MKIGDYIHKQRKMRNFSQEYVAAYLNITRQTYMKFENGKSEPSLEQLKMLATLFSIPLEKLVIAKEPEKKYIYKNKLNKMNIPGVMFDHNSSVTGDKFSEVLLLTAAKIGALPEVGEKYLFMILYLIDSEYYGKHRVSLTGTEYIKTMNGPYPQDFKERIEKMEDAGLIQIVEAGHFMYENKKYLPVRSPGLDRISSLELLHIDDTIAKYRSLSSKELFKLCLNDPFYASAGDGQTIRYMF